MTDSGAIDYDREIARLHAEYRAQLLERLAPLRRLIDAGALDVVAGELHTLAGSAGSFGLTALSECAQRAEERVRTGAGAPELAELLAQLESLAADEQGGA